MVKSAAKSPSSRIWMLISIVLFIVLILYIFANPPGDGKSEPVAKINGTVIDKDQLYNALVSASGEQTLDKLISAELVDQEAEKAGVKVTEAELEEELSSTKSGFSSDEEFDQALAMYGMTLESLTADMRTNVQLRKLLEPQVAVTDDDIQTYYNENLDLLKTPEQVKASHILVATRDEAEAILADLHAGADFAALAKEKSLDTASNENGGELDLIARGQREETFEDAAFALEIGKLSEVVETGEGFHIIKISERHAEVVPALEEKKEALREQLTSEKISELSQTWMEEIRAKAEIENSLAS